MEGPAQKQRRKPQPEGQGGQEDGHAVDTVLDDLTPQSSGDIVRFHTKRGGLLTAHAESDAETGLDMAWTWLVATGQLKLIVKAALTNICKRSDCASVRRDVRRLLHALGAGVFPPLSAPCIICTVYTPDVFCADNYNYSELDDAVLEEETEANHCRIHVTEYYPPVNSEVPLVQGTFPSTLRVATGVQRLSAHTPGTALGSTRFGTLVTASVHDEICYWHVLQLNTFIPYAA